jgi:glutamyl-tRNA reductase
LKIVKKLSEFLVEFLLQLVDKAISVPVCAAEALVGSVLSTISNEIEQAQQFIDQELNYCVRLLKRTTADDAIATLYSWAESIRIRERDRALNRIGVKDDRMSAIVDDLTHVLVKKLLSDATYSIRSYAERGEIDRAEAIVKAITESEQLQK